MKYTPADLDRMRSAINRAHDAPGIYRYTPPGSHGFGSGRAMPSEDVERQLLTHMMNETTADELAAHAADVVRKAREDMEEQRVSYEAREAKKSQQFTPVPGTEPKRWWHL